jgi:hypothetical protein
MMQQLPQLLKLYQAEPLVVSDAGCDMGRSEELSVL